MTGASVSVRHADVRADCHVYDHRAPILDLYLGGITLTLTADDEATAPVEGLVRAVEQYVAALAAWREQRADCVCGKPAVAR